MILHEWLKTQLFYCLDGSIRKLISQRLQENYGVDWWNAKKAEGKDVVPQTVREYAKQSQETELTQAITLRSDDLIDYISFGHLADIIVSNWDIFGDMFTKREAVQRVLKLLNTLRGPIAHCCPLADHEIARLRLTVIDWFQIMSWCWFESQMPKFKRFRITWLLVWLILCLTIAAKSSAQVRNPFATRRHFYSLGG